MLSGVFILFGKFRVILCGVLRKLFCSVYSSILYNLTN